MSLKLCSKKKKKEEEEEEEEEEESLWNSLDYLVKIRKSLDTNFLGKKFRYSILGVVS